MKEKITYKDLSFDSNEELYFYWWCEELKEKDIIKSIILQPKSFKLSERLDATSIKQLKTKDKVSSRLLLREHSYTPDTLVEWNEDYHEVLFYNLNSVFAGKKYNDNIFNYFASTGLESYFEVKPLFDQNNMTRLAKINQKWVYDKYNMIINIIIPEKLFDLTFTPKLYLTTTKSNKPRKIKYKNIKTIDEFLLSSCLEIKKQSSLCL